MQLSSVLMRYKVKSGIVIKSENAAKPESQPSQFLLELLRGLPHVSSSFDYGCGKLRYQKPMLARTDTLALIDSEIQLSRIQTLRGNKTSVKKVCDGSNQIIIYNDTESRV